jgi:hypothetical protein
MNMAIKHIRLQTHYEIFVVARFVRDWDGAEAVHVKCRGSNINRGLVGINIKRATPESSHD